MRARLGLFGFAGALFIAGAIKAAPAETGAQSVEPVALNCDAITFHGTLDGATMKAMEPIHSLDGVAALLTKRGVPFDRSLGTVTISLPPKIRSEIDAIPPGEPIVLPAPDGGVVCVLRPSADSI